MPTAQTSTTETSSMNCMLKVSLNTTSYDDFQDLVNAIRAACKSDYKLEIYLNGKISIESPA